MSLGFMTTFQSVCRIYNLFVTLGGMGGGGGGFIIYSNIYKQFVSNILFKHIKTDSDIVKLLSSGFFGHEATVFTGTRLDTNTVSSGKSICLNLH